MGVWTADLTGAVAACASCGQKNRRPWARLAAPATCGKCQAALPFVDAPIEMPSGAVFDAVRRASTLPILVDFWAAWCGPCRMVAPQLAQVASAEAGQALVVKVDTEALRDVAAASGIQSLPTLAVLVNGQEAARQSGAQSAPMLRAFLHQAVASASAR